MKVTKKLSISFCLLLALFSALLAVFELPREKRHKTQLMEERLESYSNIVNRYISKHSKIDGALGLLPENMRLTVIDYSGNVLYDNRLENFNRAENHYCRPEIAEAAKNGKGSNIRLSQSTKEEYLYFAKKFGNQYIRTAMPYDIQLRHLLKPDAAFFIYLIIIFAVALVFVLYVINHFGFTIKQLSNFSDKTNQNLPAEIPDFSNDEIGKIGKQIAERYQRLKESERKLAIEHEKLLMHIQTSAEGICIFTPDKKVAFYNGLFLQYLNVISDSLTSDLSDIFKDENFAQIVDFLNNTQGNFYFETNFKKHAKNFVCKVNIFDDRGFEIVLNDCTQEEKNRQLKKELTGNIAHELRTPVTAIRGYLETILSNRLTPKKSLEFICKANEQILTLSELISDMSLLSKINENSDTFELKPVNLQQVIEKATFDAADSLKAENIAVNSVIPNNLTVMGNQGLLYSIFRNLIENVIKHAGENLQIYIEKYNEEGGFGYFSFADSGRGIAEERHLLRLFERFYRVDEGRTRNTGGSGLGLSIVKNAIAFHNGTISVKNRKSGGLEFLFTLPLA